MLPELRRERPYRLAFLVKWTLSQWRTYVYKCHEIGLLAEEIDSRTGELLGNFPQAFSHVGLITAAWDLDRCGDPSGAAGGEE